MRRWHLPPRSSAASLVTVAWCLGSPIVAAAQTQDNGSAEEQPPQRQTIEFTVPLVYERQVLGDVMVSVAPNGTVALESTSLAEQLRLLLNEEGIAKLDQLLAGQTNVMPESLATIGIDLEFNQSTILVEVNSIDGDMRPTRQLFDVPSGRTFDDYDVLEPARFSAYLNINTDLEYDTERDEFTPEFFFDGATRFGDVAVEYDLALTDQFGDGTRFSRRGVRAIYDEPDNYRRFTAGDLRLETLTLLRTPFLGGVSVEKSRRVFEPFLPAARLGAGEIFLDNRSQVDVVINGNLTQTLDLDAGTYDLASLPVQLGSNNVELQIRDSGGREQTINLDYFFQPLQLRAGEDEYSFAVGFVARDLAFEPDYSDDLAFTGLYRRGITDDLVVGGAVQISEAVQLVGAETTFVPQIIPGFFDFEAAASFGDAGTAFSGRASYRLTGGNSFSNQRSLSLNVDYTSAGFTTISNAIPIQFDLLTVSASYSQSVSEQGRIVSGLIYSHRDGPLDDVSTAFVDYIHRINDRLQLTAGVEYGESAAFEDNWGVRVGVSYLFGPDTRGSADYRSRFDTFRANYSRGADNNVGAIGYDVGYVRDPDQSRADVSFDYIGNRFDSRISAFTEGSSIGNSFDNQRFRVQVGTSLAVAGDQFAVGRPIRDAFAIVHPHESLKEGEVIVGRDLSDNLYEGRSGALGGAVQNSLSSYAEQTIQYDVDGTTIGYDIGEGTARVDPPYRGGYRLEVGSDYFVSIVGNVYRGDEPVSLVSGKVEALDDDDFADKQFFTNSAGRFGLIGFAPGKSYRVTFDQGRSSFEFTVPANSDGLFRLGDVRLPAIEE